MIGARALARPPRDAPGASGPRWTRLRRGVQLAVAAFYLALPVANARGLEAVLGNLASLRLGPVDLTDPAAALSAALAAPGAAPLAHLALGAAPAVLLALALGPVFCAWACPLGLASELLDAALPWRRPFAPGAPARARRARRVALAAVLAGSAALGVPLGALLAGPRAVSGAVQEALLLGGASGFALAVLGGLVLLDLALPRRLLCRALCPSGAVLHALRTRRSLRVAHEPARCRCAAAAPCADACRWGLDPRRDAPDGCTGCLACVEACPAAALAPTCAPAVGPPRPGATHLPSRGARVRPADRGGANTAGPAAHPK